MESSEIVDVPNTGSGSSESDRNEAENTEVVIEIDKEERSGDDGCLVMTIDSSDDKQPQQTSTLALDGVQNAVSTASTMNADCDEGTKPEAETIRATVDAPGTIIEVEDSTATQRNETAELATSTDNLYKDVVEMDTDGIASLESAITPIPTSKSNEVEIARPVGSLGLLVQYASSSDDEDSEDSATLDAKAKDLFDKAMSKGDYRVADDDGDSDETESDYDESDVECVGEVGPETIDITAEDDLRAFLESCEDNGAPKGPIKAKGEFGLDDLPPIADLTITVPESECIQLGTVSGMVETLVLVESLPNFAAVDIDTVLFLDKGNRTLGQVFDVMGNVASPIYCVRFNKPQDIVDKKIGIGAIVYVAPKTEHTNFIVLSELMNQKGTDASWEDDIEPPTGCENFSDDEEERIARRSRNQQQRNRNRTSLSTDIDDGVVPSKVTVKQEPVVGKNRGKNRRNNFNRNNRQQNNAGPPHQFYKDNRGYANTSSNYTNFHQNQQPMQYDHSWHTAGMLPPPLPSTSTAMSAGAGFPMPMPPGCYPNPFAMASNPMNYGYFNLQAFPPLPPPMNTQPQPLPHPQQNRHLNTFNERNGSQSER